MKSFFPNPKQIPPKRLLKADIELRKRPKDWCREHDAPKYIYTLHLHIITIPLDTMKIVHAFPKLKKLDE